MTIKVLQHHIRLNLWKEVFDTFRDVIRALDEEGADLKLLFTHDVCLFGNEITIEYDIKEALHQPEEVWNAKAVQWLDGVRSLVWSSSIPIKFAYHVI